MRIHSGIMSPFFKNMKCTIAILCPFEKTYLFGITPILSTFKREFNNLIKHKNMKTHSGIMSILLQSKSIKELVKSALTKDFSSHYLFSRGMKTYSGIMSLNFF